MKPIDGLTILVLLAALVVAGAVLILLTEFIPRLLDIAAYKIIHKGEKKNVSTGKEGRKISGDAAGRNAVQGSQSADDLRRQADGASDEHI